MEIPARIKPVYDLFKSKQYGVEISITQICKEIKKSRQDVTKAIKMLEAAGFLRIDRQKFGNSKRCYRYYLNELHTT